MNLRWLDYVSVVMPSQFQPESQRNNQRIYNLSLARVESNFRVRCVYLGVSYNGFSMTTLLFLCTVNFFLNLERFFRLFLSASIDTHHGELTSGESDHTNEMLCYFSVKQ